jgi:hypothetical protein
VQTAIDRKNKDDNFIALKDVDTGKKPDLS